MNQKTGEIVKDPSAETITAKNLIPITRMEQELLSKLPELARPMQLAEMRYIEQRAQLGRKNLSITEKNAFRLGFKAGRESVTGGEDVPKFQFYPEDFSGLVWGIKSPQHGMEIMCQRANEILTKKREQS